VLTIIRKLPIPDKQTEISVPNGWTTIFPLQIVVSVSITPKRMTPNAHTLRFPAVIDTGFNRSFLIQEQHFNEWAGLRKEHLKMVDEIQVYGTRAPVHAANLWLHPNVPGTRDEELSAKPYCIHLDPGIAVCSSNVRRPRLPLVGLGALLIGDLQVQFDWRRSTVTLRTTPWWARWTPF
jgi:hypothetical protein